MSRNVVTVSLPRTAPHTAFSPRHSGYWALTGRLLAGLVAVFALLAGSLAGPVPGSGVSSARASGASSAALLSPQGSLLAGVTNSDDAFEQFSITNVFESGVTFGARTYTSIFVGSNGYITFSEGHRSYSPLGIQAWTADNPIVAGQYDDLHPGMGGNISAIADAANNRVVITWDAVRPYSPPIGGVASEGVTFQIVLKKPLTYSDASRDFEIEIRYAKIGWWQSGNNSAPPSAGWSTGTGTGTATPTYQELARSGTVGFNLTANESNVGDPGVYRWEVAGGQVAAPPTVSTTASAASVGPTTATLSGNVIADGGETVTARGVVIATTDNPQVGGAGVTSFADVAGGTGSFSRSVSGLSHSTKYFFRAWAENSQGIGYGRSSSFTTTAVAVPGAPTSVVVVGDDQSASLTFAAPASNGGATIIDYQYSLDSTISFTSLGSIPGTFTITGLKNNQTYAVRVRAVNSEGNGPPSASVNVTPGVATAPTVVSLTPGNAQLVLSFSAPASTGGIPITDYEYSIDDGITWAPGNTTTSPLTIRTLTNGVSYQVKIRAYGSFPGVASPRSTAAPASTVSGPPTVNSVTPGNSSLRVSFSPPGDNGGESIDGYQYSTDGTNWWRPSPDITTSPFVIEYLSTDGTTPLVNGVAYTISLRAINIRGTSLSSATITGMPARPASPPSSTGQATTNQPLSPAAPRFAPQPAAPPAPLSGPVAPNNPGASLPTQPTASVGGRNVEVQTQVPNPTSVNVRTGPVSIGMNVQANQGTVSQQGGSTEIQVQNGGLAAMTGSGLLPRSTVQVFMPLQGSNSREIARIPVDASGAFSGDAIFGSTPTERPLPIGRQVLQLVTVDENRQQTVVEMTINIAQPAPRPEADRLQGLIPTLSLGQSIATNAGEPEIVTVTPNSEQKQATVEGGGWSMAVQVEGEDGGVDSGANGGAAVTFVRGQGASVSGEGFMPGTRADVWLFSEPTLLGSVQIDDSGAFNGVVNIDGNVVAVGEHTLQLQGVGEDGFVRAANLGVSVEDAAAEVTTEAASGFLWLLWLLVALGVVAAIVGGTAWFRRATR